MDLVSGCRFSESAYRADESEWSARSLYDEAERQGCRIYKYPLKHFNMAIQRFRYCNTVYDMIGHVKRCMEVDMSIPVLFSHEGDIVDGYHRVVYAIATGCSHIDAMKLSSMPEPDGGNYDIGR